MLRPNRNASETRTRPFVAASLAMVLASSLALGTTGCRTEVGRRLDIAQPGMPPLPRTQAAIALLTPHSQRYRITVLDFVDETGDAGQPAVAIADILTTELYATRRFSLYDHREYEFEDSDLALQKMLELRAAALEEAAHKAKKPDAPSSEPTAKEPAAEPAVDEEVEAVPEQAPRAHMGIDGLLAGFVTAHSVGRNGKGWIDVDYRIINPHAHLVIHGDSARIHFESGGKTGVVLSRKDIRGLARGIAAVFPMTTPAQDASIRVIDVTQSNAGPRITIDLGSEDHGIKPGFMGFVVDRNPRTKVDYYLAKFVIISVFDRASIGVVVPHCNTIFSCSESNDTYVSPQRQAASVRLGAPVRMK